MNAVEFIEKIRGMNKPVFTVSDLSKIINKNASYSRLYAHRLKKRGILEEVERGKYVLGMTDAMVVASNITFPSYISFISGLRFYNITTQLPITVFIVCARSRKNIDSKRWRIKFVKLKKERIFGYMRERYYDNKMLSVGEIEKVVVDCLFLPKYCPIDETFNAIMNGEYDTEKLLDYAIRTDSIIVLKRLGYMLEMKGEDVYNVLKTKLNSRYDLLNPLLPTTHEKNRKWKLIINEELKVD